MAKTSKKTDKTTPDAAIEPLEEQIDIAMEHLKKTRAEISKVIYGQTDVISLSLTSILADGHALLIGVPGLAKTLLVDTLGTVLGLSAKRVQCTPDLMPADIIGTEVLEESKSGARSFKFIEGPVFGNLLMADEINRASPRTQSALLQAMQERRVSVGGKEYDLPKPFHVLATQNPIEQEGTYPLPEAQLDRFLLQIDVQYPEWDAERLMLLNTTGKERQKAKSVMTENELLGLQSLVKEMPVGEALVDNILKLVRSLRPGPDADPAINQFILWAPGPRAAQALIQTAKAYALLDGRLSPSVDDIKTLALPVLKHRMALTPFARSEKITLNDLIEQLI